ncbi:MAG: class I SAM-dependent methyltransferase [Actinobacteria bacterium]|nr:class I SAM-dependent methyltransferase [Actinomycetota bacterium]
MSEPAQTETTAEAHFTRLGAGYDDEAFAGAGLRWVSERELDAVRAAFADLPEGARVLDAGAGNGRVTRVLDAELGLSVTALDAVPEMLTTIERWNPGTRTVLARLGEPLPFETASFDAVVSLRVLKWVPAWEHALTELARVVRPGGRVVVEITNRNSLARLGYRHAPVTPVARRSVREVGARAGICWTSEAAGTHLPFALWRAASGPSALRAVAAVQRGADRALGPVGARSIVLVGERRPSTLEP